MHYWLLKSEPCEFGIDDLILMPRQSTLWVGVRNYQARNFMRDDMRRGEHAFFYHSRCAAPGIAGIIEISKSAAPDPTQFDPTSKYFDPKATHDRPRWFNVEVRFLEKSRLITLAELRTQPALSKMRLLARGNRLSIIPVTDSEWNCIRRLMSKPERPD